MPARGRHVIRINRLTLLATAMLLLCASIPIFGWPAGLFWLAFIPVGIAYWILRVQTTVTGDGLEVRTLFGSQSVAWSDIKGVRIPKRGWVRAVRTDDSEVALQAVTLERLRELALASGGRIPDPVPPPAESQQ